MWSLLTFPDPFSIYIRALDLLVGCFAVLYEASQVPHLSWRPRTLGFLFYFLGRVLKESWGGSGLGLPLLINPGLWDPTTKISVSRGLSLASSLVTACIHSLANPQLHLPWVEGKDLCWGARRGEGQCYLRPARVCSKGVPSVGTAPLLPAIGISQRIKFVSFWRYPRPPSGPVP